MVNVEGVSISFILHASGYHVPPSVYTICFPYLSTNDSDKFLRNKHISTLRNRDSKYRFMNTQVAIHKK